MNDKMAIIEKIEKLLRLGQSPNEHEAARAIEKARELMTLHQIESIEMKESASVAAFHAAVEEFVRRASWEGILSHATGLFCEIKTYTQKNGSRTKLFVIGMEGDVVLFQAMFAYLKDAMRRLADEEWKAGSYPNRNALNSSFFEGCTNRLCQRMRELRQARQPQSDCTALVVRKESLIAEVVKDLNLRSGKTKSFIGNEAFYAGRSAADGISLEKQIA